MIPAWLTRLGAKLLPGLIAAGAFFTLIVGVFRRGQKQAELEHDAAESKADLQTTIAAAGVRRDVRALGDDAVAQQLRERPWRRKQ